MNENPTHEDMENRIKVLEEAAIEAGRFQAALKESEEKFRILADSTPTAVMLYQDNHWIYANKAAREISGYSTEEFLHMNFWDIVHPDNRALVRERGLMRQQGNETINRYEFKIVTKDGTEKWVDLAGASTMIGGRPAAIISVSDITDRRGMEEELRKSEAKYRLLTETLVDVIFTTDDNLRITYVSPSVTRLCGYSVEEAMAEPLDHLLTPTSLEIAMGGFAEEMRLEASGFSDPNRILTLELEVTCKDGSTVWTETIFSAIRDKDNKFIGMLGITRDISERKKAAEEKERLISERQKALSEIKILSGMLPICSSCKKIRNDEGYWEQLENYISNHSGAEFTHGFCPDCAKKFYEKALKRNN